MAHLETLSLMSGTNFLPRHVKHNDDEWTEDTATTTP